MIIRNSILATVSLIATISFGQWTPLASGIVSSVSLTAQGADLFDASYPNGVFRSTNGGTSWTAANTGLPMSGSSIFVRSVGSNATNIFAGTHDGIYTSSNAGTAWTAANGTLTATNQVYAKKFYHFGTKTFAVFKSDIASGGGIYSTTNNGTSWAVSHVGMGTNVSVNHLVQNGATLFAATSSGLYSSTDNGANWSTVPMVNYAVYSIALSGANLVAITAFGYQYINLTTFVASNATGAPINPTAGEIVSFDGAVFANTKSSTGALRSTNGGQSYTAYNSGLSATDQTSLTEFLVTPTKLFVGALFDIYSVDGMNTGADDAINTRADFSVFPTVFDESFMVDLSLLNEEQGVDLNVLDAMGRVVLSLHLSTGSLHVVAAEQLSSGAYTYQVVSPTRQLIGHGKLVAR